MRSNTRSWTKKYIASEGLLSLLDPLFDASKCEVCCKLKGRIYFFALFGFCFWLEKWCVHRENGSVSQKNEKKKINFLSKHCLQNKGRKNNIRNVILNTSCAYLSNQFFSRNEMEFLNGTQTARGHCLFLIMYRNWIRTKIVSYIIFYNDIHFQSFIFNTYIAL